MRAKIKEAYESFIVWRDQNLWPFTIYADNRALRVGWSKSDAHIEKLLNEKLKLYADIRELSEFIAQNGISLKQHRTNGDKPVVIAYATGNFKVRASAPGDGETGLPDVQYIYSEPKLIGLRLDDPVDLTSAFSRGVLRAEISRYVTEEVSEHVTRLAWEQILKEEK